MQLFLAVLLGLVAGAAIGFQNPLASLMGQRVGLIQSAFIVHLGGAIFGGALLLVTPGGNLANWRAVPWYALAAGALGIVLIASISFTIPRIGLAATVGLLVAMQLSIAALVDHHGWLEVTVRGFDIWRGVGIMLLLAGAWLVLR